jgi:hypothetical protein
LALAIAKNLDKEIWEPLSEFGGRDRFRGCHLALGIGDVSCAFEVVKSHRNRNNPAGKPTMVYAAHFDACAYGLFSENPWLIERMNSSDRYTE